MTRAQTAESHTFAQGFSWTSLRVEHNCKIQQNFGSCQVFNTPTQSKASRQRTQNQLSCFSKLAHQVPHEDNALCSSHIIGFLLDPECKWSTTNPLVDRERMMQATALRPGWPLVTSCRALCSCAWSISVSGSPFPRNWIAHSATNR